MHIASSNVNSTPSNQPVPLIKCHPSVTHLSQYTTILLFPFAIHPKGILIFPIDWFWFFRSPNSTVCRSIWKQILWLSNHSWTWQQKLATVGQYQKRSIFYVSSLQNLHRADCSMSHTVPCESDPNIRKSETCTQSGYKDCLRETP